MKKIKKKIKKRKFPQGFKTSKVRNLDLSKVLADGQRLFHEGNLQQAEQTFHHVLSLDPENIIALYSLSCIAYETGKFDEAMKTLRKVTKLKSDFPDGHNLLGILHDLKGDLDAAIKSYKRVIALAPDYFEAYNNLGNVYKKLGQHDVAILNYIKAISLNPDYEVAKNNLENVFKASANLEETIHNYEKKVPINQENFATYWNLAKALQDYGYIQLSLRQFHNVLLIKQNHAQCHRSISKLKKYSIGDPHINNMEKLYFSKTITNEDKMHLGFALGKAYGDCKMHEKSFHYILTANKLKRSTYIYSINETIALTEKIIGVFDTLLETFQVKRETPDKTPVFILGMPRSGTSLVEQILSSHPYVYGAGEIADLKNIFFYLTDTKELKKSFEVFIQEPEKISTLLGEYYLKRMIKYSENLRYITNKEPHNFQLIGLIAFALPNAKIIHCTREPMDNCFSIYKNFFSGIHPYAYDLKELGQYYLQYQKIMEYWHNVFHGKIFNISYEKLVKHQEAETKGLLDYCELPWDDACLSFYKTKSRVTTASAAQVRQPIYKDSVELWKRYEKQLEPLRKTLYG
jgi:tetratricopeptide (TPR) repeat protein